MTHMDKEMAFINWVHDGTYYHLVNFLPKAVLCLALITKANRWIFGAEHFDKARLSWNQAGSALPARDNYHSGISFCPPIDCNILSYWGLFISWFYMVLPHSAMKSCLFQIGSVSVQCPVLGPHWQLW